MVTPAAEVIELGFTFALLDDFSRCIPQLGATDPKDRQFWRRTAYRSYFGALEAILSVQRQHFIHDMIRAKGRDWLKSSVEVRDYFVPIYAATESHEFALNENGTGNQRVRKNRFLPTLKAVVRMSLFLSDVPKGDVEKFLNGPAWDQVRKAIKVRDRITHPHRHEDATISDDELQAVFDANEWLTQFLACLKLEACEALYEDSSAEGEAQ